LFAHFFADIAPLLGGGLHRQRIDNLLHARQMLGQPRPAFAARFAPRFGLHFNEVCGSLLLFRGGALFSRVGPAQQQLKLLGIHLLAARAEDALYEQVHLLFDERVFLPQLQ
jgi:hypothetical protein